MQMSCGRLRRQIMIRTMFPLCRIVTMASLFELLGWIQWDDLEGLKSRESGVFEYSTSKLELIMAMRHLNKQLKVYLL